MSNHIDYWQAGLKIFGIYGFDENGCHCGNEECQASGKHPLIKNWVNVPDWSDEQLETFEQMGHFETGFGVLVSGLLIIDIDARNGGIESYSQLCADLSIDFDSASGFVVATGSGGGSRHLYFKAPQGVALSQSIQKYKGIDFKSSGFVIGAGSLHKSGMTYEAVKGHPDNIVDAPQELIALLKKPEHHRAIVHGSSVDVTEQEIKDILNYISPDCDYETWYKSGMAIHHATAGTGLWIFDEWSNGGDKYAGRAEIERKWHSFGKASNPVTLATLIHYAELGGYQQPVTFTPTISIDEPSGDHPFNIDNVDLLRPPGFVGEVTKWIDAQCRYPRQNLAVSAAVAAVGNVIGLRYTDEKNGTNGNLFAFCVAASATGKEAVQQAMAEVHRAAGIHVATHGAIKSEQEIIRNLIRHQAAYYIIDEVGIFLKKIANAQKSGGAVYLDGVIGILMSAYSKADGFMLLNGDTKDEVRKILLQELSQCKKAISENEDKGGFCARRVPQLERALDHIDDGLERPFLSLVGYTTPITFDGLITFEQATNGFVGRSWMINERESNPRARRGFKKQPMPDSMRGLLFSLHSGGHYDSQGLKRVEYYGEKTKVKVDAEASRMMDAVLDWIEEQAEEHKSATGLESIVRRSYELMAKIALILGAPEGLITPEHVRWAYAAMRRDIDDKIRLAYANMVEKDNPDDAIAMRIMNMLDKEHGETLGVIKNRFRKEKGEKIENILAALEEMGKIKKLETTHQGNGKKIDKWFSV
jgi:hypothetical protein